MFEERREDDKRGGRSEIRPSPELAIERALLSLPDVFLPTLSDTKDRSTPWQEEIDPKVQKMLSERVKNLPDRTIYQFYDDERTFSRQFASADGPVRISCRMHQYRRISFEGNGLIEEQDNSITGIFFDGSEGRIEISTRASAGSTREPPKFLKMSGTTGDDGAIAVSPLQMHLIRDGQISSIADRSLCQKVLAKIIEAWNLASLAEGDTSFQPVHESPLQHLWRVVRERPTYAGGDQASKLLLDTVEGQRLAGKERVDTEQMKHRLNFIQEYASQIFEHAIIHDLPVEGVVFYGSFTGGVPMPGDIDVRILIPWEEPYMIDTFLRGQNDSERQVYYALRDPLPETYVESGRVIPINYETSSQLGDGEDIGGFDQGPVLVFTRGTAGVPRMFYTQTDFGPNGPRKW